MTARLTSAKKEAVRSREPVERDRERMREKASDVEDEVGEEVGVAQRGGTRDEAKAEVAMATANTRHQVWHKGILNTTSTQG